MFGFRSGKLWKKILSITYLVILGIIFLSVMLDGKFKNITIYDFVINKIKNLILLTVFATPHIFLSNTKLRSKMPLFKANKKIKSFFGLIIVCVILIFVAGVVDEFHSQEYLEDMANHNYKIIAQVEATCTTNGKIDYLCDYCGLKKFDVLSALGHNMKEISKTEATCESEGKLSEKCEICDASKETVLKALGHNMKENSKTEATCEKEGKIVEKCERCNVLKETVLKPLGHSMKDFLKTEATCEKNGAIVKKCENCEYKEETVLSSTGHNMEEVNRKQPTEEEDGNIVKKCSLCGKEETEFIRRLGKTEEEYKAECNWYSYEPIARNPESFYGDFVAFTGKVVQVQESGNNIVIRLNVTRGDYDIWKDTVYIEYTKEPNESRILEEDILTVYGQLNGIKTYTSVMGNSVSIPLLKAKYVEIN